MLSSSKFQSHFSNITIMFKKDIILLRMCSWIWLVQYNMQELPVVCYCFAFKNPVGLYSRSLERHCCIKCKIIYIVSDLKTTGNKHFRFNVVVCLSFVLVYLLFDLFCAKDKRKYDSGQTWCNWAFWKQVGDQGHIMRHPWTSVIKCNVRSRS